jgi:hypothetical protein
VPRQRTAAIFLTLQGQIAAFLVQNGESTGEVMPRIQIKTDVHLGVLRGNDVECKCRVEIVTKTIQGVFSGRELDIWVANPVPDGTYQLLLNDETLNMVLKRGVWKEVTA